MSLGWLETFYLFKQRQTLKANMSKKSEFKAKIQKEQFKPAYSP